MHLRILVNLISAFLFIFSSVTLNSTEENFVLMNGLTDEVVLELGSRLEEKTTPCSTFKIVLCLMGFDAGILIDEMAPVWEFQEGYDDFLKSWKDPQTPKSWIKTSCFWYSQLLATQLTKEKIEHYLALFDYGNRDMSGELTRAWVNSSLKISPKEQTVFIKKIVKEELPISSKAHQITKSCLFLEELPGNWKLFGKTGWSGPVKDADGNNFEVAWFVGWIERDDAFFPFAYQIRDSQINLGQRIPRVKELFGYFIPK